jgi:hypothetical protein
LLDAFEARFLFSQWRLRPGNEQVAAALDAADRGSTIWRTGTAQDIHERGCEAFRVYPFDECEGEYDVIERRGERLRFGARPSDGNLCRASRCPIALTEHAVVRRQ